MVTCILLWSVALAAKISNRMVTDTPRGLFHGLADPTRWQIVQLLSRKGLAVSEIAEHFPMSRPAVSKHLRVLRLAGLVVERKEGRHRIYELVAEPLEQIAGALERLATGIGTQRGRWISRRLSDADQWAEEARAAAGEAPGEETADERDQWRSW